MQILIWNACIVTLYHGKRNSRISQCRHACKTHTLWPHTKENVKAVVMDADRRVKRMYCDAIRTKTLKPSCIVTPYEGKRKSRLNRYRDPCEMHALLCHTKETQKSSYPTQARVCNTCIVTPYQVKRRNRLKRYRHACGTHSLWPHTKENSKVVLTDKEKRVKHMYFDTIPRKTQKRS